MTWDFSLFPVCCQLERCSCINPSGGQDFLSWKITPRAALRTAEDICDDENWEEQNRKQQSKHAYHPSGITGLFSEPVPSLWCVSSSGWEEYGVEAFVALRESGKNRVVRPRHPMCPGKRTRMLVSGAISRRTKGVSGHIKALAAEGNSQGPECAGQSCSDGFAIRYSAGSNATFPRYRCANTMQTRTTTTISMPKYTAGM